jgi:hypothetical protein
MSSGHAPAKADIHILSPDALQRFIADDLKSMFCCAAYVTYVPGAPVRRNAAERQLSEENPTFGCHGHY